MVWLKQQFLPAFALLFSGSAAIVAAGELEENPAQHLETFEAAWQIINDSYYDPTFQGVDWEAVYEAHQPVAEAAQDTEAVRLVIRNMLKRLRQSHFALIPAAAATGAGTGTGSASPGDAGLQVALAGESVVVMGVSPGSPAAEAGLVPGDELVSIRGRALEAWWRAFGTLELPEQLRRYFLIRDVQGRLEGHSGQQVLVGVRQPDGIVTEHPLLFTASDHRWSRSFANLPEQRLRWETRELEGGPVYLRFNVFALELFEEIRAVVEEAHVGNAPGLLLDLRGNGGGTGTMASLLASLLVDEKLDLGTMQLRNGWMRYLAYPQPAPYLGPVAVLIDGRTASTGETLASGLQAAGRARLFGERTAGAVLPSMIRELPNGDRLQYVVGDFHAPDGRRLEGIGVVPDVTVAPEPALLREGRDVVLESALDWLFGGSVDQ